MKEIPILMCSEMVRATLEGRKTQTRRMVKCPSGLSIDDCDPKGIRGDRFWIKETFISRRNGEAFIYRADIEDPIDASGLSGLYGGWKPSIFMTRKACRLIVEITEVRAQRLQDISPEDCIAEGVCGFTKDGSLVKYWTCDPREGDLKSSWQNLPRTAREAYAALWNSLHIGKKGGKPGASWNDNPWVWAYTFKKL